MHNTTCIVCGVEVSDKRKLNKKNALYCSTECIKKQWSLSNKEAATLSKRKHQLGKRYGITWEDVLRKHTEQKGCCAICQIGIPLFTERNQAYVDHNHATGKVRGLLCQHCNSVVGFSKENPVTLRMAAMYIESHNDINDDILCLAGEI